MEKSNIPFQMGEWVEVYGFKGPMSVLNGTICYIVASGLKNSKVFVVRHPDRETDQRIGEMGNDGLKRMELETTDELLELMIDWALDAKDENAFYQLCEKRFGLPTLF